MKTKNLPRKLNGQKYANLLLPLCGTLDGNSLIILYNKTAEMITKFNVLNEEDVFKHIVSLLLYNTEYSAEKLMNYLPKAMKREREIPYEYEELTGYKKIYLDTVLSILLRYNKAITKLTELSEEDKVAAEAKMPLRRKHDIYPKYLSSNCLTINDDIARLTELKNVTFPKVVEKMKAFDGEIIFNDKKYIVDTPKSVKELILEGYLMHNCLVMRGPDIANERMRVVFIRTSDNKPYIDVIMDPGYGIIWAIKDMHANVEGEDKKLVSSWHEKFLKKVREMAV